MLESRSIDPAEDMIPFEHQVSFREASEREQGRYDECISLLFQPNVLQGCHGAPPSAVDVLVLIIVTSFPVALKWTSSIKVFMRSRPLPLTFSRLAGARGSGSFVGSKPGPSSRTTNVPDCRESASFTCSRRLLHGSLARRSLR